MDTPPELPPGPSTKLFLGGLPPGVTDDDLREHFETFGKVDEAVVKQPQGTTSQSHFGFLWVRPAEAAARIIAQEHTLHCASGLGVTIPAPVLARNTPMSKTRWHSLRPDGSPEAPPSVRPWFRLPRTSASLGQSAARAALAGHTGLVFHEGAHRKSHVPAR